MMLSQKCREGLGNYFDGDNLNEFISTADTCVEIIRNASGVKRTPKTEAQKRINRVKKAFSALTGEDRMFLDHSSDATWMLLDAIDKDARANFIQEVMGGYFPLCEKMQKALGTPLPSVKKSISKSFLIDFAQIAIRKDWIDVSEHNGSLTQVLKIIMDEAGVKHDAVNISAKAVARHSKTI